MSREFCVDPACERDRFPHLKHTTLNDMLTSVQSNALSPRGLKRVYVLVQPWDMGETLTDDDGEVVQFTDQDAAQTLRMTLGPTQWMVSWRMVPA